jgi:hypothetical protein
MACRADRRRRDGVTAPVCELKPDAQGGMTIDIRGDVDLPGAQAILDLVGSLTGVNRVAIDLENVDSITQPAVALLLFPEIPWHTEPGKKIVVLTSGARSREALLRAYAERRAQDTWPD